MLLGRVRPVTGLVAPSAVAAVPTFGQLAGLHKVDDPLDLKSSVAYVLDQDTHEVLFSKNPQAVLPSKLRLEIGCMKFVIGLAPLLGPVVGCGRESRNSNIGLKVVRRACA